MNGFFLGGLAQGINQQQQVQLKQQALGIQQQYANQEQQRFQQTQYMKLRSEAYDHMQQTIAALKNAHPDWTDTQILSNGAVASQITQLSGFEKNLGLDPNGAQFAAAGMAAGQSQIQTEAAMARAKEGPLAREEKIAKIKYLESGIPKQPGNPVKASLTNSNPDLNPSDELGGTQRVAQAQPGSLTDVGADVGEQAGADYLKKNVADPGEQDLVKSIANYDTDPATMSGRVARGQLSSRREQLIKEAMEYSKARGETYNPRAFKVVQDFLGSGKHGDTVRSLNVITEHMGTLKELGNALKNKDIQLFNSIAQRWAQETGKSAPTNFQSAKDIVGTELIKALGVAGAGSKDEREELGKRISVAASPKQINDAIDEVYGPLLTGQLKGLRQQYLSGGGPREKFDKVLLPATRAYIDVDRKQKKPAGDWQVEEIK